MFRDRSSSRQYCNGLLDQCSHVFQLHRKRHPKSLLCRHCRIGQSTSRGLTRPNNLNSHPRNRHPSPRWYILRPPLCCNRIRHSIQLHQRNCDTVCCDSQQRLHDQYLARRQSISRLRQPATPTSRQLSSTQLIRARTCRQDRSRPRSPSLSVPKQ